jgi:conjugative relaxase-like TrwC/TraI family protein
MLSLSKLKGAKAAAAADYFIDLGNGDVGDYYLGEDGEPREARAHLLGKLAAAFGLTDEASLDQFLHLLDGRHPVTGRRLISGRHDRVCAIDLTASAPKSVSVVWALGDDRLRRQVQAAQDYAVATMFAYIEQDFDVVRFGGGKTETADGLMAVSFAHHTSRQSAEAAAQDAPPDPQLHTHVLLMMARRRDGQIVAIGNRPVLWKRRMEAMAVYHSALAGELAELGFPIERRTGRGRRYFEVVGIPRALCDLWSSRRREIVKYLETWSAEFREKYGRAPDMVERRDPAVRSRIKKGHHHARDLQAFWRVVGEHEGVTAAGLNRLRRTQFTMPEPAFAEGLVLRQLIGSGEQSALTGKESTFSATQARTATLECATGLMKPPAALGWLEQQSRAEELVSVAEDVWTSKELLGLERDVLAWKQERQQLPSPIRPTQRQVWDAIRTEPFTLSTEQIEALCRLVTRRSTFLTGEAGVGKGVVVHAAAKVWRDQGRRVIALAVAGATAQRLGMDLGEEVETMTLRSFITRVDRGLLSLSPTDVMVVDEASVMDTRLWSGFVRAVGSEPTVVAIGDDRQLSPIGAGGLWTLLSEDGPRLTEIRRTNLPWEREAWASLWRGEAEEALTEYAKRGNLKIWPSRSDAIQAAIIDWSRDGYRGLIITDATNAERHVMNKTAQKRRLDDGELGSDVLTFSSPQGPLELRTADRVIFTAVHRPVHGNRVENGTTGTVTAVDAARGIVSVRTAEPTPRDLEVPTSAALDLYYATHVYKAQGATVDHAYVIAGGWQTNRETLYVACSRSRHGSYLYLDRETLEREIDADALQRAADRASRSRTKTSASAYGSRVAPRGYHGRRAPPEALVITWHRRQNRRSAARLRPQTVPPRWAQRLHGPPQRPGVAAIACREGVPEWVAEAAQSTKGRSFGATG